MRGKPKGIRRKQAKQKSDIGDKILVSMYGDVGERPEIIDLYLSTKWAHWEEETKRTTGEYPNGLPDDLAERLHEDLAADIAQFTIDAIVADDSQAFRLLADLVDLKRSNRCVDEIGAAVADAVRVLKYLKKRVTARAIIDLMEKRDKAWGVSNPQIYDEADIRRIVRDLNLK
jgi:hypothetical protein